MPSTPEDGTDAANNATNVPASANVANNGDANSAANGAEETPASPPLTAEEVEVRNAEDERKLSQAMITLRKSAPFFYTLAYFARNYVHERKNKDDPFAFHTAA